MDRLAQVRAFHEKFAAAAPNAIDTDTYRKHALLRFRLMLEELTETAEASGLG